MPIYEYRCANCGFQKEYLQKMGAALLTDCPECGNASLAKMVTAAGFKLKGSGWYATDFKTPVKPKTEATDSPAAKTEDKAAAKSDEKPAAKAETQSAPESATSKTESAKTSTTSSTPASST